MTNINNIDLEITQKESIYTIQLDEKEMDNDIVDIINQRGDEQNNSSNVKAQMTNWLMIEEKGFERLAGIVTAVAKEITFKRIDNEHFIDLKIKEIWGMKYQSGDYAGKHRHFPALYSFVYYINPSADSPDLYFSGHPIKIKNGLLVLFSGNLQHEVKQKKFTGYRYAVSGNIY